MDRFERKNNDKYETVIQVTLKCFKKVFSKNVRRKVPYNKIYYSCEQKLCKITAF